MENLSSFQLKPWQLKAVEKGFENAFSVGPVVGYSVVSCHFTVHSITVGRGTSDTMIASAIVGAVQVECGQIVVERNHFIF
jgi:translation elongation factor EF-G